MHEEVLIPAIIFFSIVAIVKIVTDSRTRRQLIEKGLVDDRVKDFFGATQASTLSNLKWGMILVAIGVAIFVSRLVIPYYMEGEGTLGLILIFAGIAVLIYYAVANNRIKNPSSLQQPGNQGRIESQ